MVCDEKGLAKKVINQVIRKFRGLYSEIYDEPLDYLKKLGGEGGAELIIHKIKELSVNDFESHKEYPTRFNKEMRESALMRNFPQN